MSLFTLNANTSPEAHDSYPTIAIRQYSGKIRIPIYFLIPQRQVITICLYSEKVIFFRKISKQKTHTIYKGTNTFKWLTFKYSHCYCWVTKVCPSLCDPMDYSMPGSLVLHYLPEFAQNFKYSTHIIYNGHSLFYLTTIYTYLLFVECLLSLKRYSRWRNTSSEQDDKVFTFMELATL